MRKLFSILLLMLSLSVTAQTYRVMNVGKGREVSETGSTPTWTNLEMWLSMTESSGTVADSSGNGYTGTVYNATQSTSGITFDGTGDSVSISPFLDNVCTIYLWVEPDSDPDCDIFGGESGAFKLNMWTNYRLRAMQAGAGGTSVTDLALTNSTYNFVSLRIDADGDSVRFGVGSSYETETNWTYTPTVGITTIGASKFDLGEFVGKIKYFVVFSDLKTDAYTTAFYNSGNGTFYSEGDPL